ncbi:MAG: hypothetical protein NTY66_02210, partial [Candidatus Vogelbacteria bacterium]|nr:hypothetical protein [Candidatus Vogelbacteria bacterium]
MIPGARGRGYPLKRRTSHVSVLLDIKQEPSKSKLKIKNEKLKIKEAKIEEVKSAKKTAPKKAVTKKIKS